MKSASVVIFMLVLAGPVHAQSILASAETAAFEEEDALAELQKVG